MLSLPFHQLSLHWECGSVICLDWALQCKIRTGRGEGRGSYWGNCLIHGCSPLRLWWSNRFRNWGDEIESSRNFSIFLKVERILQSFLLFMNENNRYLQDQFYQQQFILKMAAKEESMQKYFKNNPESISWIIGWINESELPNLNSNSMVFLIFIFFLFFHDFFMIFSWFLHDFFMIFSWFFLDFFLIFSDFFMIFLWFFHDFFMIFSWFF